MPRTKPPETIYLIPGEDVDSAAGWVWRRVNAPRYADNPRDAIPYIQYDAAEKRRQEAVRVARNGWLSQGDEVCRSVALENAGLLSEIDRLRAAAYDLAHYADGMVSILRDLGGCPGKATALEDRVRAMADVLARPIKGAKSYGGSDEFQQ